jgi:hypothetical protein
VYALADKYDVPPLRGLVVRRLKLFCDPTINIEEFVAVMRVTDACTAENTIWDVLLPLAKSNIGLLLANESFRELVVEIPTIALSLLDVLGGKK